MLSEKEARDYLRRGQIDVSPLKLHVVAEEEDLQRVGPDFVIDLEWQGVRLRFVAEYKAVATPRNLEAAIGEAKRYAAGRPEYHPMVLVPHISDEGVARLRDEAVSGLDFSGNMVVIVPGQWLVLQTGRPNRFPSSRPIKKVYEGKSALVGRVLLSKPEYGTVTEVRDEIVRRGGSISLGTVSKVLSALEEDLVVQKDKGVRLIQPARLLDRLAETYRGPEVERRRIGKIPHQEHSLKVLARAGARYKVRMAGRSESLYVVSPTSEDRAYIYVSEFEEWLDEVPFKETERFANVVLAETDDEAVFFDATYRNGFPWCSKLQIYLELMHGGKRERDAASQIRQEILNSESPE